MLRQILQSNTCLGAHKQQRSQFHPVPAHCKALVVNGNVALLHKHQQWNPTSTWLSRELVLSLWFFNSNHYPQPCKAYSASSFSLRSLWNLRAKLVPECLNLVVEYRNTSQIPSLLFMAFLAALPKGCNSFAGWSSGGKIPGEKYISRTE